MRSLLDVAGDSTLPIVGFADASFVSSLERLSTDRNLDVTRDLALRPRGVQRGIVDKLRKTYANDLNVLSSLVIHDKVVFDADMLACFNFTRPELKLFDGLVEPVTITPDLYDQAGKATRAVMGSLKQSGKSYPVFSESGPWFDGADKAYWDGLNERHRTGEYTFADSQRSPARSLFFLEMGRQAGVQLCLSSNKRAWFETLASNFDDARLAQQVFHEEISEQVREAATGSDRLAVRSCPLILPPLPEYLLRVAVGNRLSLIEAAQFIAATDQAKQYRAFLASLRGALIAGDTSDVLRYRALRAKLDAFLGRLQECGDVDQALFDRSLLSVVEGVIKAVPIVGEFLATLPEIFMDKTGWTPRTRVEPYVAFLSDWVNPKTSPLD